MLKTVKYSMIYFCAEFCFLVRYLAYALQKETLIMLLNMLFHGAMTYSLKPFCSVFVPYWVMDLKEVRGAREEIMCIIPLFIRGILIAKSVFSFSE